MRSTDTVNGGGRDVNEFHTSHSDEGPKLEKQAISLQYFGS